MSDIIQSTTQQFLDIYDITNNFVIMKDGTVSTILTVDAMNFGLLAEEEQDAIMYAYAGLLNSLNYSVQILINSRTKDVTSYLKVLQEQESVAENETMRRRIRMYREFVGNLIHERNVLDKKFYVVIPAAAVEMGFLAPASLLPGKTNSFDISSIERSVIIEKAQNLLDPKRDHLIAQFARIGLFSRQLTTQEIIQLFYVRYNPEAAEGQQIGESITYTTPLVKASIQENFMNTTQQPVVPPQAPQPVFEEQTTLPGTVDASTDPTHVQPLPEIHVANTPVTPDMPAIEPAASPTPLVEPSSQELSMPSTELPADMATMPYVPVTPLDSPASPAPLSPTPLTTMTAPAPVVPFTPPTPAMAQPVTPMPPGPMTPITPVEPVTAPPTPLAEPVGPTAPPAPSLEKDLQADLNATVQALGSTPDLNTTTPPAAATDAGTPAVAQSTSAPTPDLPPLPEI